jgi:pheromone shutdown protein TraB
VNKTQADYSKDQAAYIENMRKKYPTLVRVLIDERNEHMAKEISKVCSAHRNVVAVVGDGHVDGLLKLLPSDLEVRAVRLAEIMDDKRLKELKTEFWESPEQ